MEHLTPLDAAFLDAEDEDRDASLAIASIAILEGPAPDQLAFIKAVSGRLPLVPRYRQKVRTVPLDLGQPVWVDDPHFDLAYHVRRTAVPAPGDDAALCRLVARVMAQRLDRDRPLWECWVIEGLADGRWAVLSKIHHCVADGMAGNLLYRLIFDGTPEPSAPIDDAWKPVCEPSTQRLTLDALGALALSPVDQVRLLARAIQAPAALAGRVLDTARGLATLAGVLRPVTRSTLSGPIGRQRRYAVARASLPEVVRTAQAFGVTVNDVVLAAISGAFRALLIERGEQPNADSVRSLVPVSVRARDQENDIDNRISMMLPLLPVDIADPVLRLSAVHARMAALKASKEAEAGEAMTALARHEPFAPISYGIRLAARLPQRNIVTVTTNVPGPRQPLYLLRQRVVEILPYVPIALRLRTGISVLTYCDRMSFGITADYNSAPETQLLGTAIEAGIADLLNAARALAPQPKPARTARTTPKPVAKSTAAKAVAKSTTAKSTTAKSTAAKSTAAKSTAAKSTAAKSTAAKPATATTARARRTPAPGVSRR
jgi:diacylglycerol O-acyltransferase